MRPVPASALSGSPFEIAPQLIGLVVATADGRSARLVEVEAYGGPDDDASHARPGRTARNATMWGPVGRLYVYFSYGVHWCANVVCHRPGEPGAVLLRAAQPLSGLDAMRAARWRTQRTQRDRDLCRGPGRLCQAFGIDGSSDGADLCRVDAGVRLLDDGARSHDLRDVVVTQRIGISRAADQPARYVIAGSPWASGPRLAAGRRSS